MTHAATLTANLEMPALLPPWANSQDSWVRVIVADILASRSAALYAEPRQWMQFELL